MGKQKITPNEWYIQFVGAKLLGIYWKITFQDPAFRLGRVKVNRVRANGEGMGCTQRELQQPCSM
ncbi:MAG: hypothetical protein CMA37_03275 [Euryarchaeota archaeon]|nr:hypothetical protein [Euryarchaeota archaeon]